MVKIKSIYHECKRILDSGQPEAFVSRFHYQNQWEVETMFWECLYNIKVIGWREVSCTQIKLDVDF